MIGIKTEYCFVKYKITLVKQTSCFPRQQRKIVVQIRGASRDGVHVCVGGGGGVKGGASGCQDSLPLWGDPKIEKKHLQMGECATF